MNLLTPYPGQPWQLVICECGHVELQHLRVLGDDVGGRAILLIPFELIVGLDDVRQLVGQVILEHQGTTLLLAMITAES